MIEDGAQRIGHLIAPITDVEQLRRLGERDYIEFTINTKNKPQKVGGFLLNCAAAANVIKKRYNVALVVDDAASKRKSPGQ